MDPDRPPAAAARQRWRLAFRRSADAPPLPQREWIAAWEEGLTASGLPLAMAERGTPRPRLSFGAPLGVGMPAERELVDLFLAEIRPVVEVREAVGRSLPDGHELIEIHDVWVGAPPLPASVVALVYRVALVAPDAEPIDVAALADAATRLLASTALPRRRAKGDSMIAYDLRPLLAGIEPVEGASPPTIRIRVRVDPERGIGRPEEVVAALGDDLGTVIEARDIVRERVETADEASGAMPSASGRRVEGQGL
jgi:radical SAM-linked protein